MKKFSLYEDFASHVGLLDDDQRLEKLGLDCGEDGRFDAAQAKELLDFVAEHSAFHIVSQVERGDGSFALENRLVSANAICLYLANGSASPAELVTGS